MSEEQNLFEPAAAAPPPRVRTRKAATKKTAASSADSSSGGGESGAGEAAASPAPQAVAPAVERAAPAEVREQVSQGSEGGTSDSGVPAQQGSGRTRSERPRGGGSRNGGGRSGGDRPQDSGEAAGEGVTAVASAPENGSAQGTIFSGEQGAGSDLGGSSKSRRRRRKRKNRAAQAAGGGNGGSNGATGGSEGAVVASVDAVATRDVVTDLPQEQRAVNRNGGSAPQGVVGQGFQSGSGSNGGGGFQGGGQSFQNANGNARRNKKKKFRRAGEGGEGFQGGSGGQGFQGGSGQGFQGGGGQGYQRPPRPEPGNSLQGSTSGMGQRRNRKQQQGGGGGSRGPRTFVGPMDHSYREVNGNFADVPASTIQVGNGRHRSNGHRAFNEDRLPPELMHNKRPVAIPEDAPTHIYFFIEDLFFTAKIQEAAKQQGVKVAFMKPDKDVVAHLSELHDHEHPSLIVFDLNNVAAKPLTLIPKLKAKLKKGTSILGFLSHLQGDLKQKAVEAGCHTVMPRSAFSQNLPNLLRRYGVEDEHEPNFNQ